MLKGRTLKVTILSVILLLVVTDVAVSFYSSELLVLWITLTRDSSYCPRTEAYGGLLRQIRASEDKDTLAAASRRVETDPAGLELWETPEGRLWAPKGSADALMQDLAEERLRIYGSGDWGERRGDTVLDCGANIGLFTRVALRSGAKLVVAIEPAPENLECLRRNVAADIAAGRVIVYPKGVWDKDDFLEMNMNPGNSAANSFVLGGGQNQGRLRLPLTTIDKLAAELKLDRVDFIKMDVEGAERRALAGARETLAKYHPRLSVSAYHLPDDPDVLPSAVRQGWAGYRMRCGLCGTPAGPIRPEILYFR